ncbi:MAG: DUF3298 and DUF4163 domain-containing protein [Spirochaetaceae bacterium]|nr:DUF3298 and DUF4163 domain-containing protein [Spirochaetaceae bacterium]
MKKIIFLFLAIAGYAINNEPDGFNVGILTINDNRLSFINTGYNTINSDINLPNISGSDDAEEYSALLANRVNAQIREELEALWAATSHVDFTANYDIYQASNLPIVSLLLNFSRYTGGANAMINLESVSFNYDTGERLEWANIFSPQAKDFFVTDINRQISEANAHSSEQNPTIFFDGSLINLDKAHWFFNQNEFILIFDLYELGPRASGNIRFSYSIQALINNDLLTLR